MSYGNYKNSQASMNNWSPAYIAQFDVSIVPPAGISDWKITLEGLKSVKGINTNFLPEIVEDQTYRGAVRSYLGGAVPKQTNDISLTFDLNLNDSNSLYIYKSLRQWCDLVYDPLTGKHGMKKDYIGGPLILTMFNKDDDIYRQVTFPVVFPLTAIPLVPDLDWNEPGIITIEDWQLRADYFEENIV